MFFKILQWVQIVVSLIREAEDQVGAGRGREKRKLVVAGAQRELGLLATAEQIAGCDPEDTFHHVGALIDAVVALLNCLGVLRHQAPGHVAAPTSAPAEPPSSDPGPDG